MEDVGADWVAKSQPADVYSLGMVGAIFYIRSVMFYLVVIFCRQSW